MDTPRKKILVVDDDPDILDASQFILEDAGFEVKTTEKGEDAESLDNRQGNVPDLILLDVLLSGKDGRTICRKLKSQLATKDIPIIMMSAHPDAKRSTKEVGADDFIAKPFDIDILLTKIETHLQHPNPGSS